MNKFVCILFAGCVLMTGCGNASSTNTATENTATVSDTESGNSDEKSDSTVTGMIESIEDNTITLSVMNPNGGGRPDGEAPDNAGSDSATGDSADNSNSDQSNSDASDASVNNDQSNSDTSEASDNNNKPSGGAPDGNGTGEKPSGGAPDANGTGEKPSGGVPDGNGTGEKPSGGVPDGNGTGEKPSGEAPDANGTGEKPSGEAPDGNGTGEKPSGEAPDANGIGEKPSGEAPDNNGGGMPGGESKTITVSDTAVITDEDGNTISLSDLSKGTMVTIELDEDGNAISITIASKENGMGGPGQSQGAPESYTTVNEYTTDTELTGENIESTGTDENAVLVSDGAEVSLDSVTVNRNSEDSTGGDNASFYGVGAATLVTDGTLKISNSTIETDASGAAGVFAYGDGTAYVSDTTIKTEKDTSGGIHVAGGGTLHAENLTVETKGQSAAAIRSDRGGGTMTVDGGSYTSNGLGSPAVYCTADITVADADLTATGSEAVCIEGLNSLKLTNCNLTGAMTDQDQNDCTWNVILYQSMSGDSEVGNSTFSMTGGTLTAKNGGMFYTTNTESTFYLSDVDITYADQNDFFLKCTGNGNARGWGESGSNGADCTFTADSQEMQGDIIWDSISTLTFNMENDSVLTGAIVQDESNAGNGGDGYANVVIDSSSKWVVTGDSVVSDLNCKGTIVDENGKTVTIKDTDGNTLVDGNGTYTITVSSYENQ